MSHVLVLLSAVIDLGAQEHMVSSALQLVTCHELLVETVETVVKEEKV